MESAATLESQLLACIEIEPDRLYWVALSSTPTDTRRSHYFSIDEVYSYEAFYMDFGPLDLSCICRYCHLLEEKLKDPALDGMRIIHYCSCDPNLKANAILLSCAYQVVVNCKTSEAAYRPFLDVGQEVPPFRDASRAKSTFDLTISDCLSGLENAMQRRWLSLRKFDIETYLFCEQVENGDMNWIIPDKFLAFAEPWTTPTDQDGFAVLQPEDYVPIFRSANINLVVRLNKKQYDRARFCNLGIRHVDLYFADGSCPPAQIVDAFFQVCEHEEHAIAVHCKAGLCRTGTLIGLYAMKQHRFPARAYIGWNRMCRPGSILGPQQNFIVDMESDMFQAGNVQNVGSRLAVEHRLFTAGEMHTDEEPWGTEDVGQGEALLARKARGGRHTPCTRPLARMHG
eukprot:NODE_6209_length_1693_cov_21.649425.p1 GENE.NODE_6209_length_1693_cov_21.649425~~NODE_6209_length_1693_cov_21.649425.p1  ORF type:complete len:399 (+),score=31.70 NODE_6209_length_1693_cov_21.649425:149-1345(+)